MWEQGDSDTENRMVGVHGNGWRMADVLKHGVTQYNSSPFANRQEKVMYLISIVGTGYQQEEPREGVVGWTWKTGFVSFTKEGKKKKNMVLLQGGEHGLLIICLCDRHHFGWHFQNTAIVRKWCETFETEKAAFFPVRALLSEPCAGFYRKGLACPKDKTFIQRKRETSSLTWSTWKERAKGILLGYKGHGCVLFSLTQEHELVPSCMLILHP